MKGTELRVAFTALDKVTNLAHYRPETAQRAVGATLAYLGARRLLTATRGEADGALERRILQHLAGIEDAAIRLDAIPQRSDHAAEREAVWNEILVGVKAVHGLLRQEQNVARMRADRSARTA